MAKFILVNDPMRPTQGAEVHTDFDVTIWEWLNWHFGGFEEFDKPTVCVVNGEPCLRADWKTRRVSDGDMVHFFPVVQGIETLIVGLIVAVVAAVAVSVISTTPTPNTPGRADAGQPDPVFTFKGRQNQNRLGFPVEAGFGFNRFFPSYAARPYTRYINNEQFFYALLCLGHGSYEVSDIWIEDSQISNFQEAEAHIVGPGEDLALFDNNVITSGEVGSIELFGPNEENFDDWTGPFILNPTGTQTDRIEIDFVLPEGLYVTNDLGGLTKRQVTYEVEFQQVDDSGVSFGDWINPETSMVVTRFTRQVISGLGSSPVAGPWVLSQSAEWLPSDGLGDPGETITEESGNEYGFTTNRTVKKYQIGGGYALRTNTPQRFTEEYIMPNAGRWQVRGRRTNNAGLSHTVADKLLWESARAYLQNISNFGDKTMVAVKIRASNNLNDSSSQRINVWATRKLPIWDPVTGWSDLTATRNPVWATLEIFKSLYGGRLGDEHLDLETWKALADDFESEAITFDWIFDASSTIWEAAQAALAVGRTVPIFDGSKISAVRDNPKTLPVYIFNHHNIIKGSFSYDIKLPGEDEFDALEVTYQSENERSEETILCQLSDDPEEPKNPEKVRIPGITNIDNAYRMGLYLRAKRRYHSRNLTFRTGTEGYLPTFGDLIGVNHDLFEWGQGSFIESIDGATIELFEPVTFTEGESHQIVIRDKFGDVLGPFSVTEGATSTQIIAGESIPTENLYFDDEYEAPLVQFGVANEFSKLMTVVRVRPLQDGEFEIAAVNYAPIIYTFDGETAPVDESERVSIPSNPTVTALSEITVTALSNTMDQVIVRWPRTATAGWHILEQSFDEGNTWQEVRITAASFSYLTVSPGRLDLRVASTTRNNAFGARGDYAYWVGIVGVNQAVDASGIAMVDDAGNVAIEPQT
ncbi:MAG: host specificity factor TipJ family phage tail protein [Verrucomicrobiota bacterium]